MKRLIYLLASIAVVNLLSMNTVQADLVLHYKFDEGSGGDAYDTAGVIDPNTATVLNFNTSSYGQMNWADGKYGSAVEITGDYYPYILGLAADSSKWIEAVERTNAESLPNPNAMSIAIWFNRTSDNKWNPRIASARDAFALCLEHLTGKPQFFVKDSAGTDLTLTWNDEIATGQWTHLAGTFDGTTAKLYVNGVRVVSGDFVGPFSGWKSNPYAAGIGHMKNSRYTVRGSYDELRIYNDALSDREVADLAGRVGPVGIVEVDDESIEITEGDTQGATIFVHLSIPPESGEDVTVSLEDDSVPDVVTMTPSTLVFTEADYDIPQLVTVTASDNGFLIPGDWDLPPDNAYSKTKLSLYVTSADPYYATPFSPILDVKVFDNECGAYGYNQKDLNKDCIVNFEDFALFAAKWMATL